MRIEAVAMALEGADFLQVFRYFLDGGQNEAESFVSTQRVFRGVPVSGGFAFTKDTVYLRGLIGVHTFFRHALHQDRLRLGRWLFAGKMTLHDVVRFEPLFLDGTLVPPRWLPPWIERANGLTRAAGVLAVRQPHPHGPDRRPAAALSARWPRATPVRNRCAPRR